MWEPGLSDLLILMPLASHSGAGLGRTAFSEEVARAVVIGEALHWGFAGAQAGGGGTFW